jgi:hypothetical protein
VRGFADRLGEGVLTLIEQVIPAAAYLEDYSALVGAGLVIGFALIVILSLTGIARRR